MTCHKLVLMVAMVACYCGGFKANALVPHENCDKEELCDLKPDSYDDLQKEFDHKIQQIKKSGWNLGEAEEYELGDRPKIIEGEGRNCRSRTKVYKPYTVKKNGTTKAVVQTKFFEQTFLVTECWSSVLKGDGDECFEELALDNPGSCQTRYTSISLFVYNDQSKQVERIAARLPVCCSCMLPRF